MSNDTPTAAQYQQAVNELSVRLQVTENQRNEALNANASLTAKVSILENALNNMQANSKSEQVMPDIMEDEVIDKPKVLGKKANTLG